MTTKPTPPPAGASKISAINASSPPAVPPAGRAAPQQAATFSRAPGPHDKARFNFKEAREKLPLKLYSNSGQLASFYYSESEYSHKGEFEAISKALNDFNNELTAYPRVKEYLLTPTKTKEQKVALVKSLAKGLQLHPLTEGFILSMINTNMIKEFPKVVHDYGLLLKSRSNTVDVTVTLAEKDQPKPKPETVRNLLEYGPEAKINLTVKYDPSIAGGAILSSTDRVLDLSFKKELDRMRATLAQQQAEAKSAKRTQFTQALAQYGDNLA